MTSVLVTYASRRGSTGEIARVIADKLRETGLAVDCVPVVWVTSLQPYDAVVLGSAVYFGRWRAEATGFLRRFRAELTRRALWTFSSGPVGEDEPRPTGRPPARVARMLAPLGPRGHIVFGGCLPAEPRGRLQRYTTRRVPRAFRDRRDWGEIRAWAIAIAQELGAPGLTAAPAPAPARRPAPPPPVPPPTFKHAHDHRHAH